MIRNRVMARLANCHSITIGSGEAADIGASRRLSHSNQALSGTYPCPSRLGQTWIGNRPRNAGGFRFQGRLSVWWVENVSD